MPYGTKKGRKHNDTSSEEETFRKGFYPDGGGADYLPVRQRGSAVRAVHGGAGFDGLRRLIRCDFGNFHGTHRAVFALRRNFGRPGEQKADYGGAGFYHGGTSASLCAGVGGKGSGSGHSGHAGGAFRDSVFLSALGAVQHSAVGGGGTSDGGKRRYGAGERAFKSARPHSGRPFLRLFRHCPHPVCERDLLFPLRGNGVLPAHPL